jgi:MFS family permease
MSKASPAIDGREPRGGRRAWIVAIILAALSTTSFLDRQVLALLVPDLRRDLGLTDIQIGWLIGPAFFVVYNLILVPASVLVDRWNRKWLILIGVTIWSLMTIASGFARDFHQLLVLRAGLAFGEALLGPAAISLIGDLFDRVERPLPTATYIVGSVIGGTGSAMLSAAMLQLAGLVTAMAIIPGVGVAWRLTLIGVGLPGLFLAAALLFLAREPSRSPDASAMATDGLESPIAHLRRCGLLYGGIFTGIGFVLMIMTSVAIWGPIHLIRTFAVSQVWAGYVLGGVSMVAGVSGTLALAIVIRRLILSAQIDKLVGFVTLAMGLAVAAGVLGGFTSSLAIAVIAFGAVMFLGSGVGTLPTLVIQLYAPAHLRGRIAASLFFLLYLLGSGLAPVLVPVIARSQFSGPSALGRALCAIAVVFGGTGIVLLAYTKSRLKAAEAEIRATTATLAWIDTQGTPARARGT